MKYQLAAFAISILCACGDDTQPGQPPAANSDTTTAQRQYFPVFDFLKSEIAAVDSLPAGIMLYHTIGERKDSGYIKLPAFHALVDEFVKMDDETLRTHFKESSFLDKSTGAATFFYSPRSTQNIQRIDVVTEKTDTYDKVKSLYIEKTEANNDSTIIKKIHWTPGKNFQLIRQVSKESGEPGMEIIRVVWDNMQ